MDARAGAVLIWIGFIGFVVTLYLSLAFLDLAVLLIGCAVCVVLVWLGRHVRSRAQRSEPVRVPTRSAEELSAPGTTDAPLSPSEPPLTSVSVVADDQPSRVQGEVTRCARCGYIFDVAHGSCDRCGAPAT